MTAISDFLIFLHCIQFGTCCHLLHIQYYLDYNAHSCIMRR